MNEFLHDEETPDADVNPTTTAPTESLQSRLRREREELREGPDVLDLVVPTWPTIGIRYASIPGPEFEKFAKRITKNARSNLLVQIKMIVRATECILVREEEDGPLVPLLDGDGDPLLFDDRLAEYLDLEKGNPSSICHQVFSADKFPLAPGDHADAYTVWMRGREEEIDEALKGE